MPYLCQCPHGLLPHFYHGNTMIRKTVHLRCQCPHGLLPHFYGLLSEDYKIAADLKCQCPHGLLPHFYGISSSIREKRRMPCQCPHGLLPHFYGSDQNARVTGTLSKCQCPHGLLPHFYDDNLCRVILRLRVSMPSRAFTSFLQD